MSRTVDYTSTIEQWSERYNLLVGDVGDIDELLMTPDDSLVAALNQVYIDLVELGEDLGDVTDINSTILGSTLVDSVNNFYSGYLSKTGQIDDRLDTAESNISTLTTNQGLLSNLDSGFLGPARASVVAALNFIYDIQTGETVSFTNATVAGTLSVGGKTSLFDELEVDDNVLALNFITPTIGSINNGAGSRVDFSSGGLSLVSGAATSMSMSSTLITLFRNLTTGNNISVTGSGNVTIGGNGVWHAGNDGAASGLDADLLDGQHGSYYLNYNNLVNRPTIGDGTITLNAGSGVSGGGSFSTNRTSNLTISFEHANTSTVTDITTSGKTVVSALTFDSFGHVLTRTTRNLDFYTTGEANALFAVLGHTHSASDVTSGTFVDARIPNLNASKTNAGVFDIARIPDLAASKTTSGTFADARIPNLNASKTNAGVFDPARLGTGTANTSTFLRGDGSWQTISQNVNDVLAGNGLTRSVSSGNITLTLGGPGTIGSGSSNSVTASSHTHALSLSVSDIPNLPAGQVTSGTFANARISSSSVTQHQAALSIGASQLTGTILDARLPSTLSGKTFSSQVVLTNGSVSAPGVRFGDANTGLYRPNTNQIGITISGTQRLRVQSTGVVITGSMIASGEVEGFSDIRLKDVSGKVESPFDILNEINGVWYNWKPGITWLDSTKRQIGVIAQDVEKVLPEAVGDDGEGNKTVAYTKLIPVLLEAIKELEARVKELENGN